MQPGPKVGVGLGNYNHFNNRVSDNSRSGLDQNSHHQIRYKEDDEVTDSEEEIGDESGSFAGHSIKTANPTKPSAGGFQRQQPVPEQNQKHSAFLKPGPPPAPGLKPGQMDLNTLLAITAQPMQNRSEMHGSF